MAEYSESVWNLSFLIIAVFSIVGQSSARKFINVPCISTLAANIKE